jgi:nicotinate-nucleotide pyrophosphorylase (carboxylating)
MRVLREALARFLAEDIGRGDITSEILPDRKVRAEIVCKERAVIAGLHEASIIFDLMKCRAEGLVGEGAFVKPKTTIMKVGGKARSILSAERTALNVLMRMSGIATETRRFVDEVEKVNKNVKVACTRKTSPGFRVFDKRAVKVGGGETHRMRLDEMMLIKDNHIAVVNSVSEAVRRAKLMYGRKGRIEIETRSLKEAIEAAGAGADIIMLDNMPARQVHSVVRELGKRGLRENVVIEVSGGIMHENVQRYASADIDIISIGSITHSVKAVDMSLEIIH